MFQMLSLLLSSGERWKGVEPILVGLLHSVSFSPDIDQFSLHTFVSF
jgi:hypothetical protein